METKELKEKLESFSLLEPENAFCKVTKTIKVEQKEGYLVFVSCDFKTSLEVEVKNPNEVNSVPILIDRKSFLKTIKKIKDKEIQIKITKNELTIQSSNFNISFSKECEIEDYIDEDKIHGDYQETKTISLEPNFILGLQKTLPFVSRQVYNYSVLTNVYLDLNTNRVASSDGKIACVAPITSFTKITDSEPILIPIEAAKCIIKLFSKTKERINLWRNETRVKIFNTTKDRFISFKQGSETFPITLIDKLINENYKGCFKSPVLLEALKRLPKLMFSLKIIVDNQGLSIETQEGKINSKITLPIEVENQKPLEHKGKYDQRLLITCLENLKNPLIEFRGLDLPIRIREGKDIRILMPVRFDYNY